MKTHYGDRIRATGLLAIPATWDNFSYADYLGRQGVFTIVQNAGVEVVGTGYGNALQSALINLSEAVKRSICFRHPRAAVWALDWHFARG